MRFRFEGYIRTFCRSTAEQASQTRTWRRRFFISRNLEEVVNPAV